ncbi:MAG TPA: hypothetical protein VJ850_10665 [Candidatus Limnocylindrales bacterium]|nr:hypothetical protein [Candidatus Limnocylindrales bacterium]
MTDQPRRRLRAQPSARPVGAPNVLSNQATPNRLSTMGTTGGGIPAASAGPAKAATRPVVGSAPLPRPTIATGRPATVGGRAAPPSATDDRFERPSRRPKLGTIITIGFVIFWALRFFNSSGIGGGGSTPTPRASTRPPVTLAPRPTPHAAKGQVVFGEEADSSSCGLDKRSTRFTIAVEVYYEAEMEHVVAADATVVIIEKHDNVEIDRQEVPPDPDVGAWARFCGGGPVAGYQTGVYRLEIWNEAQTELLSSGSFTRYDPTATPTPRPSRLTPVASGSPLPTVLGSVTGKVTFGTAVGEGCALSGLADTFSSETQVWWRADLKQPLPAATDVRLVMEANLSTIADHIIPSASVPDPRSVICGDAPIPGKAAGDVYVWIWNLDQSTAYATGIFHRKP